MEPLRIPRFEHAGRSFPLKEPLLVDVELDKGTWIYHNSALNLWGHGERPDDALRDLHENFSYLWDEIAQEDDDLLDGNAREIKRRLLKIVAGQHAAT